MTNNSTAIVEEYKGERKVVTEQMIVIAHNGRAGAVGKRQVVKVGREVIDGRGYGKFAVTEVLHNANFGHDVLKNIVAAIADREGLPVNPRLYGIRVNGLTVYQEAIEW